MSGAATARDAVRRVLTASYKPVFLAGRDYAAAYQAAVAADDLVEALAHTVDLILAAEHLHEIASEAAKAARTTLAATMESTGATQIASGPVTAHIARRGVYVVIDPAATIPAEYLHTPTPQPDKSAIRKAIEAGETVAGATLVRPNDFTLSIRSSK